SGKTDYTQRVNAHDNRLVYVMQNDHPKYQRLRDVFQPDTWNKGKILKQWISGPIRIVSGSRTEEVFDAICSHVSNAKICFEDAAPYIKKRMDEKILRLLV